MIKYKLIKKKKFTEDGIVTPDDVDSVMQYETGSDIKLVIPFIEENSDYQKYLAWVSEGNKPEPADEEE
tara:strand:+ start:191 stop:397 length:207 start_codon:yes stop_codon:yes gene_type:complete